MNEIAITYYKDIPMSRDEYASLLGNTIIEQFEEFEDLETITFVKFNKEKYQKWLDGDEDTQSKRAKWAVFEANPARNLSKKNKVEKTCIVCGEKFQGTSKSKYCSNKCKQRFKNAKK